MKFGKTSVISVLVFLLVICVGISFAQDKVSIDRKDWIEFRLGKINQEFSEVVKKLREKNPEEYKKIDALTKEATELQKELQTKTAPAKPVKK